MDVIEFPIFALNCPFNPASAAFLPTSKILSNWAGPFNAFSSFKYPHPYLELTSPLPINSVFILVAVVKIVCWISCPVIQGNLSLTFAAVAVTLGAAFDEPGEEQPGNSQRPFAEIVQYAALSPAHAKCFGKSFALPSACSSKPTTAIQPFCNEGIAIGNPDWTDTAVSSVLSAL